MSAPRLPAAFFGCRTELPRTLVERMGYWVDSERDMADEYLYYCEVFGREVEASVRQVVKYLRHHLEQNPAIISRLFSAYEEWTANRTLLREAVIETYESRYLTYAAVLRREGLL